MPASDYDRASVPNEVKEAIRKEASSQVAKWVIAALLGLASFTIIGWWYFLEPKIRNYIADAAGGVPANAILSSSVECEKLPGKWVSFKEGTGRFLIGAGSDFHSGYSTWLPEGGSPVKISEYKVLQQGGKEKHLIKGGDLPSLDQPGRKDLGRGDQWAVTGVGYNGASNNLPINIVPPYVAVHFCKKQ